MFSKHSSSNTFGYCSRGEIAFQGFESLAEKFEGDPEDGELELAEKSLATAPDKIKFKKRLSKELTSSLLPLMRQQIIKIYISPVRICLPKDPGPMLESIIECQSELAHTWLQIQLAVRILCPNSAPSPLYQHADEELVSSKFDGLFVLFQVRFPAAIMEFLKYTLKIFQRLDLTHSRRDSHYKYSGGDQTFTREGGLKIRDAVLETIDLMIKQTTRSELDFIQHDWPNSICLLDNHMAKLVELINQCKTYLKGVTYPATNYHWTNEPHGWLAMHLFESLLSITRLARILFKKLSRRGMNTDRLPFFTKLGSSRLERLSQLPDKVVGHLEKMLLYVTINDMCGVVQSDKFPHSTKRLEELLKSSVADISQNFRPLATDNNDFPTQSYFETWFTIWSAHFDLALGNLRSTAKKLDY
ncbi:hypothetical protein MJO28_016361 [Puccinia striiformis f. sp. tritici]|uniref:Uncharacterized protein n=1 Tax=Puccinia striiformis f. sp. tritici TaxID=168172 RepID=A0ACC0DPM4_9BASI|nr:hypothetical protein MJO28_016361 [Puccinia striiformis f. sp. tritici]